MSEVMQGGVTAETPVNPYSLLEAVNNSSDTANTAWLIFLGIMAYLMVAVAGVTHKDLLLETPVSLPILGVQVQQSQFFQFAPVIMVLFHLGVVSQLVLLARKTLEFDYAVCALESTDRRTHPLRLEVHNFFFVQAIAGPQRSPVMSAMLHGISWLTLAILPVVLLLYIQISFLPYHSVAVTWTHRICLLTDVILLLLLGIFLMRLETSFWSAFVRTSVHQPFAFTLTAVAMVATLYFAFFVATIPGERLEKVGSAFQGRGHQSMQGFAGLPFLTASSDGALFGIFHRNLIVTDNDLVPDQSVKDGEATLVLRGRDLRYAKLDRSDLHGADLTGARLDGASLVGADLRWVRLQCADLNEVIVTENRVKAQCPSARGADFSRANMREAKLAGADLREARFDEANLEGLEAAVTLASGASFSSARLDKADLTGGVHLQGANLLLASMQGADLTGANLQFADLSSAMMQGAVLSHANLQGSLLRDTRLEAADLNRAKLHGADMSGAVLSAADLRGAGVWLTAPPAAAGAGLGDLSQVEISALSQDEAEFLSVLIDTISTTFVKVRVKERLSPVLDIPASRQWATTRDHQTWQDLVTQSRSATQSGYEQQLSGYLTQMMCRPRWRNGGVATGLMKRAQQRHFRGSLRTLHERLSAQDCPVQIDPKLMARIAVKVDLDKESAIQPPAPAPVSASSLGLQP